jgi:hypothetical protein
MSSLWNEILERSSLARAIRDIHMSISDNKIANVHFESKPPIDMSVQIPVPMFLDRLPSPQEPSLPGLWITTANHLDEEVENEKILNKNFALLLLEDEDKIIANIQAEATDISGPLTQYIKLSKPTQS